MALVVRPGDDALRAAARVHVVVEDHAHHGGLTVVDGRGERLTPPLVQDAAAHQVAAARRGAGAARGDPDITAISPGTAGCSERICAVIEIGTMKASLFKV